MDMDFYGLFDYQSGDDDTYEYTASEFVKLYRGMTTDGVINSYLNKLAVSANGFTVSVDTGACFIGGRYAEITESKTFTLSSSSDIKMIVVRCDIANRKITLETKDTTTITYTDFIKEIPLAALDISASGITITDKRVFNYTATELMEKWNQINDGSILLYARYA